MKKKYRKKGERFFENEEERKKMSESPNTMSTVAGGQSTFHDSEDPSMSADSFPCHLPTSRQQSSSMHSSTDIHRTLAASTAAPATPASSSSCVAMPSISIALPCEAVEALFQVTCPTNAPMPPQHVQTLVELAYKEGPAAWDAPKEALNQWLVDELFLRLPSTAKMSPLTPECARRLAEHAAVTAAATSSSYLVDVGDGGASPTTKKGVQKQQQGPLPKASSPWVFTAIKIFLLVHELLLLGDDCFVKALEKGKKHVRLPSFDFLSPSSTLSCSSS